MVNPFKAGFAIMSVKQKLGIFGAIFIALLISHASVYFLGRSHGKQISKDVIHGYELKVANMQAEINKGQSVINERVNTVYVDRYHTIENVTQANNDVINDYVISRADTVSVGWIYAHNQAVLGLPIEPQLAANDNMSGIADTTILKTVSTNYGVSNQCIAQVEAWNDWYTSTRKMYDDYSASRKAAMEKKR